MNKYAIVALVCFSLLVVGCENLEKATKVLIQGTTNPTPLPETGPRDEEQIKQSVVKITSQSRQGTGFVVGLTNDTAYILTVSHVVAGDSAPSVEFLDETREFKAKVLENEPQENGMSLLTVTGSIPPEVMPLYLVNNFAPKVRESVFTFGFPRGGGDWSYDELSYSSPRGREWLFSDSDIKEGNSGSPLMKGDEVIGMVTSTTDFAYAISAMSIREFLRGARGGQIVLSDLEKWHGANWRETYKARLKEVAMVRQPVSEEKVVSPAVRPISPPSILPTPPQSITEPEEKLPKGIIIAFAAEPGGIAIDTDEGEHGLYTKYLLQEMQKPQQIEKVFQKVSRLISEDAENRHGDNQQVPWYNASLSRGSFCFGGCSKASSKSVKQLALVIGNNGYPPNPLQYAINDAQAIAKVLNEKGFEVILKTDTNLSEMNKAIQEFVKRLSVENGVGLFYFSGFGLFYFSGFGVQVDGKDYLLPVDYNFKNRPSWPDNMVSVDRIAEQMQSANSKLNIVILDSPRIKISLPEGK